MTSPQHGNETLFDRYRNFQKELQRSAQKWFAKKSSRTQKNGYILHTRKDWEKDNLIEEKVTTCIEEIRRKKREKKERFALHYWVHHGLSSQAACFSFFGSMLARNNFQPLMDALPQIEFPTTLSAEFEYERASLLGETGGQPTSIDFVLRDGTKNTQETARKATLFFEFKLSEAGFGGCSVFARGGCTGEKPHTRNAPGAQGERAKQKNADEVKRNCYLSAKNRKYWDLLQSKGFTETAMFQKSPLCPMANYYQFFREILFMDEHGDGAKDGSNYFILVYDARNPLFSPGFPNNLWNFLMQFVPKDIQPKCIALSLQEIISAIGKDSVHYDWSRLFIEKYGLEKSLAAWASVSK